MLEHARKASGTQGMHLQFFLLSQASKGTTLTAYYYKTLKDRMKTRVKKVIFQHGYYNIMIKAAGDKLLMNKFIRQNFGGGLTLKNFRS